MFLHSQFVVRVGFPLNNGDGAQGAVPQAIAQAVAELIFHQASNAIDDLDGALMTGGDAEPAAIAFFIDHDHFLVRFILIPPAIISAQLYPGGTRVSVI